MKTWWCFTNNDCARSINRLFLPHSLSGCWFIFINSPTICRTMIRCFIIFSYQNIVKSGRWALSPACAISSFFDLPWVIGCISCIYIALTVVVIVELFKIKNPVLIFLISGILAASPATTETFFYEYTADGYMLAMLLSACAAYLSRIDEKRVSRQIISATLVCLSCAIYQAYLAFSLILATCYFIYTLLENRNDNKTNAKWILRQAIIYISSLFPII